MSGRVEDCLNDLQKLPPLDPPKRLKAATLNAMAAAAADRGPGPVLRAALWIAVIGASALIAVFATSPGPEPVEEDDAVAANLILSELAAEGIYLERMLAALPQRNVMRVSTASTIAGLEDQILLIDAELYRASAEFEPPGYQAALMRERNDMMNALVNVRYAQSVPISY